MRPRLHMSDPQAYQHQHLRPLGPYRDDTQICTVRTCVNTNFRVDTYCGSCFADGTYFVNKLVVEKSCRAACFSHCFEGSGSAVRKGDVKRDLKSVKTDFPCFFIPVAPYRPFLSKSVRVTSNSDFDQPATPRLGTLRFSSPLIPRRANNSWSRKHDYGSQRSRGVFDVEAYI